MDNQTLLRMIGDIERAQRRRIEDARAALQQVPDDALRDRLVRMLEAKLAESLALTAAARAQLR